MGRPNVGKSTLLNQILGTKVAITSDKPQTTRTQVRGVLHLTPEQGGDPDGGTQVVFVDTPGIHKPRTALGEHLNDTATQAVRDVDVVCLVIDATAKIGPGDRWVAGRCHADAIVVVNKVDAAGRDATLAQLAAASELPAAEYVPVSARTGEGVDTLVRAPGRPHARGAALLPRRRRPGVARRGVGGRAGARAAAGRHP